MQVTVSAVVDRYRQDINMVLGCLCWGRVPCCVCPVVPALSNQCYDSAPLAGVILTAAGMEAVDVGHL